MNELKIDSIKPSRFPLRLNLRLSNGLILPLLADDCFKLSLKKNQAINQSLLTQLVELSFSYLIEEYSLRQIALSPKTDKLLGQKINIKSRQLLHKYPLFKTHLKRKTQIVSDIISKLSQKGLLNELDYARFLLNRHRHKSENYLKKLLSYHGINPHHLPYDFFTSLTPDLTIKKYLLKKFPQPTDLADFNRKNKFIASMLRKGFSHFQVKTVIDDYLKKK